MDRSTRFGLADRAITMAFRVNALPMIVKHGPGIKRVRVILGTRPGQYPIIDLKPELNPGVTVKQSQDQFSMNIKQRSSLFSKYFLKVFSHARN